jgi:ankyrin repeat protein
LISAVKTASLKMIRLLLEEGADPNATDKNQANSLVYAIERNDEGILKLLLSKGTEVNNMDINKIDPLHHAIRLEHLPFIKLLLRGGASTTTSKKRGVQLIMMACDFGDPDLFDLLIEKGISWNTIDENGRNVVMRSYLAKNISLTQRLLIHYNLKSYVNFKDKHGNSLLMLAIKQEDLNFIEYLLQTCENLQIDQRNDEGKTPLLLACELNLGSIARALASRMNSTQINMADSQKNTALIWAVKHHNLIIISALLDNKDIDTTFKDALDKSPYDYAHTDEIRHLIYNHQLANKGKEAEIRVARDMAKRVNKKNKQSHL